MDGQRQVCCEKRTQVLSLFIWVWQRLFWSKSCLLDVFNWLSQLVRVPRVQFYFIIKFIWMLNLKIQYKKSVQKDEQSHRELHIARGCGSRTVRQGLQGKKHEIPRYHQSIKVAIKVVKLEKFREIPKLHEFTINEIQTLSKIENVNIVRFIEMLKTSNNMYLIYEFCNGNDLEHLLQQKKYLSESETMKIFAQILNAFKSLSKENILHRDLKPSNILFNDDVVKIADFGFCKSLLNNTDLTQTMVGSPIYMAPEVLKGCPYNTKADIWSLGVVLYECLFGYCPFEDKSIARLIMQIDNKELQIPRHVNQVSRKCEDLLRLMLQVDPRKRVDWNQLFSITFYEDPQVKQPQLIKKQSSSSLAAHPLADKTNQQMNDDKYMQAIWKSEMLIRERNKITFLSQVLSAILEQNTFSQSTANSNGQLTFSQKTAVITFLLMKSVVLQSEQLKKHLEDRTKIERYFISDDFIGSHEYKQLFQVVGREHEIVSTNLESFRGETQKALRYLLNGGQSNELIGSIRGEFSSRGVNAKVFLSLVVMYVEELMERLPHEESSKKMMLVMIELMECVSLNEFFEKAMGEQNVKFTEQKYFEQMRRLNRDGLEELLKQKVTNAKFRLSK